MAQTFPASLQNKFNQAGFQHELGDSSITSEVDVGLPKKRQRYTSSPDTFNGTIELHMDDYSDLRTFFKTTLASGSLTFNFEHPITKVTSEFQFVGAPSITTIGGNYFRVSFSWREVL